MNIVEYFEMRKREADEQLAAIETGKVRRLVQETDSGSVDVTNAHKEQLRQASKDYWRAAENLKRINSSQK
jgi:multidrug resistance efflux pump